VRRQLARGSWRRVARARTASGCAKNRHARTATPRSIGGSVFEPRRDHACSRLWYGRASGRSRPGVEGLRRSAGAGQRARAGGGWIRPLENDSPRPGVAAYSGLMRAPVAPICLTSSCTLARLAVTSARASRSMSGNHHSSIGDLERVIDRAGGAEAGESARSVPTCWAIPARTRARPVSAAGRSPAAARPSRATLYAPIASTCATTPRRGRGSCAGMDRVEKNRARRYEARGRAAFARPIAESVVGMHKLRVVQARPRAAPVHRLPRARAVPHVPPRLAGPARVPGAAAAAQPGPDPRSNLRAPRRITLCSSACARAGGGRAAVGDPRQHWVAVAIVPRWLAPPGARVEHDGSRILAKQRTTIWGTATPAGRTACLFRPCSRTSSRTLCPATGGALSAGRRLPRASRTRTSSGRGWRRSAARWSPRSTASRSTS